MVLAALPGAERRPQALLGLGRTHEYDTERLLVGGGRPLPGDGPEAAQQVVGHRLIEPPVVGARTGEQKAERHRIRPP